MNRDNCMKGKAGNAIVLLFTCLCLFLFSGCAKISKPTVAQRTLYQASSPASVKKLHTPAFLVKKSNEPYNRIGMPSVREKVNGENEIYVDPAKSAVFFDTFGFTTARGNYRNLVYRIHFEKVPFGLGKLNLTAGNNPGILFIYTLNDTGNLVLVTTVHTCGCFLAFFPTNELPQNSYPIGWPEKTQRVFGQTLPSRLPLSLMDSPEEIVFTLESETHRISGVTIIDQNFDKALFDSEILQLLPMRDLYHLPFRGSTVSFFEMEGPREGYVKNNTKILEKFFISWWAFDQYVGEDKAYGTDDSSKTPLYTSLKFWAREESDLKDFPRFLTYWGWRL